MTVRIRHWLGLLFDAGEDRTAFGRALLRERYRALQRQIPLLYAIAIANFVGLHIASGAPVTSLVHPVTLLVVFAAVRLVHWVRMRGRALPPARILSALRRTLVLAGLLSIAFGYSAITLYGETAGRAQDFVILFASLAAIGCAYGLASFPTAARLPLLLFALPFAACLAASGVPAHSTVGISLGLITLLILRLVNLQSESFTELVWSRSEVETERERALRAEQIALDEKARVREVADSDPLTGLANRRAFLAELEGRIGARGRVPTFALALLDLDGFKPVNDTFGHAAGDALLIEVAGRLRHEAGAGAFAARIGGDEFALILPCGNETALLRAGQRVCAALGRPFPIEGREFAISACCGLVMVEPGGADVATALGQGDAALYSGKQEGRGSVALFTPAIAEARSRRIAIERALREPGVTQEIGLAFQPIFDLSSNRLRAFEALARWHHKALGPISPGEFIPITEQINAIEEIGSSLFGRACAEAAHWPGAVRLSFNLSPVQLCATNNAARLLAIAAVEGVDPSRLQFEVTEPAMLVDFGAARLNLERLRAAGAQILLDDFGAGLASISSLREMIFDAIKLDGALIRGATESDAGERLLKGVLELCESLRLPCIAEQVEHPEQLALLRALGCRDGQGFALTPPLFAEEARTLAGSTLVPFPAGKRRGLDAA